MWGEAWGEAWGDAWGYEVTVITRNTGGMTFYHARVARDFDELRQIIAQIAREDEEILAVIVAAVQAGILP